MTTLEQFMLSFVEEDTCPECLGELDVGFECCACDYDGADLMMKADDEAVMYGNDLLLRVDEGEPTS